MSNDNATPQVQRSYRRRAGTSDRVMGDREDRERVLVQLLPDQIDQIIEVASGVKPESAIETSNRNLLINGNGNHDAMEPLDPGADMRWIFRPLMADKGLSQSLLIGLQILTCFPLDGTHRGVAEVARQLGMNNSTVHRYLTTLLEVGLLERDPDSRWYRIAQGGR
jgi:hypothetical protein